MSKTSCEGRLTKTPLPSGDGGLTPTPSLQVRIIDRATAKPFIEKWHYSENAPPGKNIYFGWFVGEMLYAVADYGHGANMNSPWNFLNREAKLKPGTITKVNLVELKRLCRMEPKLSYSLTQFLSVCHRLLKRDFGVRFIISFSDPQENKFQKVILGKNGKSRPYTSGGIYAAANFKYLGQTNAEMHVKDKQGNIIHRRVAYKQMWRANLLHCVENGVSVAELKAGWRNAAQREKWSLWATTLPATRKRLGYTMFKTQAKDRWLLAL